MLAPSPVGPAGDYGGVVASRISVHWRDLPVALWSRRTWLAVAHLIAGGALWVGQAGLVLVLVGLFLKKKGPPQLPVRVGGSEKLTRLIAGLVMLVVALVILFALTSRFTAWQRARFRAILGVELVPFTAPRPPRRGWRWLAGEAVSRRTWRQVRYHALGGPLNAVAVAAVIASVPLGGETVWLSITESKTPGGARIVIAVIGVALVFAAPWVAQGAARLDLAMARALQPSGVDALAKRVESLSASRAGTIDAADAERRRIERNLHDGTQQRLVSLAMNLGMTRAALRDARPEIREAVVNAHEEAKQALAELRDFIRGLHPAVLDELGLDAALSGIAARSPVPVRLSVDLPERPPVAVEAVAYFVVSEALTNVARHAVAGRADVVLSRRPDGLFLSVTDDGCGGADPSRGTGLRGLQQRVESVDGTWHIASPPGGPTSIVVTLPCAS
jgi:signal transduction histidine kinase